MVVSSSCGSVSSLDTARGPARDKAYWLANDRRYGANGRTRAKAERTSTWLTGISDWSHLAATSTKIGSYKLKKPSVHRGFNAPTASAFKY